MKFLYSKAFIKQIFLAIIIFSVIVLFSILFLFFYTKQTSKISVPNLIGLQLSDVEKIVKENKLRYEVIDSSFLTLISIKIQYWIKFQNRTKMSKRTEKFI